MIAMPGPRSALALATPTTGSELAERWRAAESLFAAAAGPVLLVDPTGIVTGVCGAPLLGPGLLGRPFADLAPGEHRSLAEAAVADAIAAGAAQSIELPLPTSAGVDRWFRVELTPLAGATGATAEAPAGLLLTMTDVTARREEEARLRRSERLMVDTQGTAHLGTWEWEVREAHATYSAELYRIYGLDPAVHVPSYEDYLARVHPDDRARVMAATDEVFKNFKPYSHDERIFRTDGEMRYLHTWAEAVLDRDGKLERLVGVCQDITDRRLAEEEVEARLREKELLLREVNHRVKNNLQVITSLLSLQAQGLSDPEARQAFLESQNRVRAMSIVHETLHRSEELSRIPFSDFAAELATDLFRVYRVDSNRVHLDVRPTPVTLGLSVATSCALILNELVSNALKHAFPDGRSGTVTLELTDGGGEGHVLGVRDDGVGLASPEALREPTTLGMSLVQMLVQQIAGTLEVRSEGAGTAFTVRFPPARV